MTNSRGVTDARIASSRIEAMQSGGGSSVLPGVRGPSLSNTLDYPIQARVVGNETGALYLMEEIDYEGNDVGSERFYAWEQNGETSVADGTRVTCVPTGDGSKYVFFRPNHLVRFDGSCKIDNTPANRGMAYPGNTVVVNQRTVGGPGLPDANTEEWLLVKLVEPVTIANGMILHMPLNILIAWIGCNVGNNDSYNFGWEYYIITADFNTAATTWNNQPASVAGCWGGVQPVANPIGVPPPGGGSVGFNNLGVGANKTYGSIVGPSGGIWLNHPVAYGIMFKIVAGNPASIGDGWWSAFGWAGFTTCLATINIDPIHAHSFITLV